MKGIKWMILGVAIIIFGGFMGILMGVVEVGIALMIIGFIAAIAGLVMSS